MHGYVKLMMGPFFFFCEGTHQLVLGPLLLLMDHRQIVAQEQVVICFFIILKISIVLDLFLLLISIELKY